MCIAVVLLLAAGGYFGGCKWLAEQRFRSGERALKRHDLDEARQCLDGCLALRPNHAQARLLAARTDRLRGDLNSARRHLDLAERLSPDGDAGLRLEKALLEVR